MSKARHPNAMPYATFDLCCAAVGAPGTGKSEWALRQVIELQRNIGCYVIAHDAMHRLPDRFHDGSETGLIRHSSETSLLVGLAKEPGRPHALNCGDATEVIEIGKRAGMASLSANGTTHDGRPLFGVPVVVYLDEAVMASSTNPRSIGDDLRVAITQRRGYQLGIVYTVQSPRMVHWSLLTLSTDVRIFRCAGKGDHERLEEAGVPGATCQLAATLTGHESVHHAMDPNSVEYVDRENDSPPPGPTSGRKSTENQ